MKYIGLFKDINNKAFTITIISNGDATTSKEVLLGDTPILTEVKGEDNLFKPVKYSSATIKILSKDLMYDLYSSKALGTKVILSDSLGVRWTGYLTPNLYNLGFEYDLEEVELEAIDGLSTLQYIDYSTDRKDFKDFTLIISNILLKCNCYRYFYLPYTYLPDELTIEHFFTNCAISESNFFDEDGTPMKCNEVLEELCKFMGVTCVAEGDSVYFVDYDSIRNNMNDYYRVEVGLMDDQKINTSLSDRRTISKDSYSENGTLISLGNTYNKISVKDSLYSVDEILPAVNDKKCLTNRGFAPDYYVHKVVSERQDGQNILYDVFYKYYDHTYYKSYYYDKKTLLPVDKKVTVPDEMQNWIGATITKCYYKKREEGKNVSDLQFKDYIYLHGTNTDNSNLPVMDVVIKDPLSIGGSKLGTYIVFQGDLIVSQLIPLTDFLVKGGDSFTDDELSIKCSLRYGHLFYNGLKWVDSPSTFRVYFDAEGNYDHILNKTFKIKTNLDYKMNLHKTSGFAIPIPETALFTESPKLTIYQPTLQIDTTLYPLTGYWLRDFNMSVEIGNYTDDLEFKSDTEYTNIINEDFVNDFEGEDFKVCTWDNKQANFSAVIYYGSTIRYLDKIYNRATREFLRSEELYINRLLRQNSTPPYILEISMYNDVKPYSVFSSSLFGNDKQFVVDEQYIDWRMNTNKTKLVEKK